MKIPATLYIPTRASDGQGGYTEVYGVGVLVWISGPIPGEEVKAEIDAREFVNQGDVIGISSNIYLAGGEEASEYYRVKRIDFVPGKIDKTMILEKIDRPFDLTMFES